MHGTENIGSITGIDLATLIASTTDTNNKCIGALTVFELQDIIADNEISQADYDTYQIGILKQDLNETDYIVAKLAEALASGDSTEVASIQSDYADQLKNRKVWRSKINELESSQ